MKWSGVHNGELIRLAAEAGFEALVTKDGAVRTRQHERTRARAVIFLEAPTNDIEDTRPIVPALLAALVAPLPRGFVVVRSG